MLEIYEPCTARRLEAGDEVEFFAAMSKWPQDAGFALALGYESGMSYQDYLKFLDERERGINLPEGAVPMTLLFGFMGERIVGRASLRHRLTDSLLQSGGHIGYGVLPEFRGQGLATSLLRQTLSFARTCGLSRVVLTCDDGNAASIRTIEKCGGILENTLDIPSAGGLIRERRYWIRL